MMLRAAAVLSLRQAIQRHFCWSKSCRNCILTIGTTVDTTTSNTTMHRHKFSSRASDSNNVTHLKALLKPFYLKCHPDVQTSVLAKRVNLRAIQNLNSYLDLIEQACHDKNNKNTQWPKQSIMIEFLLSNETTQDNNKKKKKDKDHIATRRRMELAMPSPQLQQALSLSDNNNNSTQHARAVAALVESARLQIQKVLGIAGLPTTHMEQKHDSSLDELWESELHFLREESSSTRFANNLKRPPTTSRQEASRRRFIKTLDHDKLQELYDEAFRDAQADLQTTGWIRDNPRRRQDFCNAIVSRVRVVHNKNDDDSSIDVLDQLSTLRRLSLVLLDHFDELEMEDMGKMWENMTFVLLPPRSFNTSSSALQKRKRRMQETGFGFTLDKNGQVIIHVPMDFGVDEFVQEMQANLGDFYRMTMNQSELLLEDLMPSWAKE